MTITLTRAELDFLLGFAPPALAEKIGAVVNQPTLTWRDTRKDNGKPVEIIVTINE